MEHTRINRDLDFLSACSRKAYNWPGDAFPTTMQVVDAVLAEGAPRFYTTYDSAYYYVTQLVSGRHRDLPKGLALKKWQAFAALVRARREKDPTLSVAMATMLTLQHDPAPSFFISRAYAHRLYFSLRRRRAAAKTTAPFIPRQAAIV